MQIKRFTAGNVQEALRLVKAEFGGDAVILSTRGIAGRGVEITAAADREAVRVGTGKRNERKKKERTEAKKQRNLEKSDSHPQSSPIIPSISRHHDMKNEFREIRDLLGTLVSNTQRDAFFNNGNKLSELQGRLVASGVDEMLSYKTLQSLRKRLSPQDMEDISGLLRHLRQFILKRVPAAEIAENGNMPKIAMFVGPTGVGKTTTIAKLAAINSIQKKKNVALVTLDTYRIAAVEQLKVYARIIGIPLHVVGTPADFAKTVTDIKGADIILVDTAGRGQRDKAHMEELRRVHMSRLPLETHLVLSMTAKERDTMDVIRRYKDMKIDRLLFTKLDETTTYGGIFNALIASGMPPSFLTTGQSVPEDIEEATSERIADLILNTLNRDLF